jgi:hypothetical protein
VKSKRSSQKKRKLLRAHRGRVLSLRKISNERDAADPSTRDNGHRRNNRMASRSVGEISISGPFSIDFLFPEDALSALYQGSQGDARAAALVVEAAAIAARLRGAVRDKTERCLSCPRPIDAFEPFAVFVAQPKGWPRKGRAISGTMCRECAEAEDVSAKLRIPLQGSWRDLYAEPEKQR